MRKFSKKGAVVFGAVLAVCALVVPSMASASSWGVIGSEHTLTATDLAFLTHVPGSQTLGWTCRDLHFTVDVRSAAVVTVTGAAFTGCVGTGTLGTGCTATVAGTNFHWTATGIATNNVQIHGVDIDIFFETGAGGSECAAAGSSARLTGTLTGATWNGNGVGQHSLTLPAAGTGLSVHSAVFGTLPITISGGPVVDRQQTLTLT